MAHPGGRPSKYDPSFVEKVDEYLQTATRENMHLPKLVSFARFLNVNKDTVSEWTKKYPEFSVAVGKITTAQEERLLDDGIYGGKEVNASIVKLVLNNHGYRDRTDITTDGQRVEGIQITIVEDKQTDE